MQTIKFNLFFGKIMKKQIIETAQLKEMEKIHYLFSYGTLQLEKVQQETYGRTLKGNKDILEKYRVEQLEITDKEVLATSGKKYHPIAIKTNNSGDKIEGTIFEITGYELTETDKYEVSDYKRTLTVFASGKKAWIYVAKNQ